MNDKCRRIYEYIKEQIEYSEIPSVRDICRDLDIKSTSTVHKYLNELEQMGLINRSSNKRHYISLTNEKINQVPILGAITAGKPITAIEEIQGYVPFTNYEGSNSELFALKVRGDSMINAGIFNGDIIIIKKTPTTTNGKIVVALVGDEATVKTFYKENGHYRLQPENDSMEPIIVDEVNVLGVVIASVRRFS